MKKSSLTKDDLRREAKAKLSKQKTVATPKTEADISHVIHELQVHQIELEMQNDELRRAQAKLDTERTQAEKALQESKNNTEMLINVAAEIILSLDTQGCITLLNDNGHKILGYDSLELIGKNWFDTCLPEELRVEIRQFFQVLKSGVVDIIVSRENEVITKNGERKTILWHNTILKDNDGKFIGVFSSGEDITERVQADVVLRASEEKLRAIVEQSENGIVLIDEQGIIIEWNHAQEQITGFMRTEALGQPAWDVQFQQVLIAHRVQVTVEHIKQTLLKILETGQSPQFHQTVERAVQTASGEPRITLQNAFPIKTDKGYRLGIIFHDITKRKQAEEALIASEEKWHLLVKAIPDFVSLHDSEGRFLFLNHYAEGFSEKDVIGSSVFQYLSPKSLEIFKRNIENCHSTKTLQKFEHTAMGDHGVMREYENYVIPIINKNEPATTLLVSRDVTERKQAEDELRRTKESLTTINIELQTALAREKQLARTDILTGVNNRRYLFELVERAFDVAARYQQPLSVMMIDIDRFKGVNDTFGHAVGDQILQRITQSACAELRSADIIGRYGGEEFVIVLPMTNAEQAYPLAERIRESVAAIRVPTSKGDAAATLSIGIAEMIHVPQAGYSADDNTMDNMLRRADEAMYAAKQAGRNCIVISEK